MTVDIESFLARLYVDEAFRKCFLDDRAGVARRAGLSPDDGRAVGAIDPVDLALAAASYARKRSGRAKPK